MKISAIKCARDNVSLYRKTPVTSTIVGEIYCRIPSKDSVTFLALIVKNNSGRTVTAPLPIKSKLIEIESKNWI